MKVQGSRGQAEDPEPKGEAFLSDDEDLDDDSEEDELAPCALLAQARCGSRILHTSPKSKSHY